MIVTCSDCGWTFDDAYRWTICPHETFAANDGANNFAHHVESLLTPPAWALKTRGAAIGARQVPACKFCTDPAFMSRRPVIKVGEGNEFAGVVWLHPTVGEGRSVECEYQKDLTQADVASATRESAGDLDGVSVETFFQVSDDRRAADLSKLKQPRVRNWYGVRCVLFWWDKLRGRHRGTAQERQWFPHYV